MSQGNIFPVRSNERVAVFIDGPNLHAASKTLGIDVDYKALRSVLAEECDLVRVYYYTAILEGEEYTPIKPLVDWLDYNGFAVVTKPAKQFTDSFGRTKIKGNLDVEITIDMIESGSLSSPRSRRPHRWSPTSFAVKRISSSISTRSRP